MIRATSAALYLLLTQQVTLRNVVTLEPNTSWLEVSECAHGRHREILDCLTSGDVEGAEGAARAHNRRTLRLAPRSFDGGEPSAAAPATRSSSQVVTPVRRRA